METVELNNGHWVEALHATHIVVSMVEKHVAGHPVVQQSLELAEKAAAASEALADLYQAIGARAPD